MAEPAAYLTVHTRHSKAGQDQFGPGGHVGFSVTKPSGESHYYELTVDDGLGGILFGSREVRVYRDALEKDGTPRLHDSRYKWIDSEPIPLRENQLLAVEGYARGRKDAADAKELTYQVFNLPDTVNCTEFVSGALAAAGIMHSPPLLNPRGYPDALDKPSVGDRILDAAFSLSSALSGSSEVEALRARLLAAEPNRPLDERSGLTPLMAAARLGWDDVAGALLARGADPSARDANGRTAWDYEARNGADARERPSASRDATPMEIGR